MQRQRKQTYNYISVNNAARLNIMSHRRLLIEHCTEILNHAGRCAKVDCPITNCAVMKRVWKHVLLCPAWRRTRKCKICSNVMILLSYHAKHCRDSSCNVLYCKTIKYSQAVNRIRDVGTLKSKNDEECSWVPGWRPSCSGQAFSMRS